MVEYIHTCKYCGKEFASNVKVAKFCNRECYMKDKTENCQIQIVTCSICGGKFRQKVKGQIFCSVGCRAKSTENRIECKCDFCGEIFYRKQSEVYKNNRHYCSDECRYNGMFWSNEDSEILINNYGEIPYKDMIHLFSTLKDVDSVKRRAKYLGVTNDRKWTQDEIDILIKYYPTMPIDDVMKMLPNKTISSIRGQARTQDLKSLFYLTKIYTKQDEEYLINNYLDKNNAELAKYLSRDPDAIAQKLRILGLKRPNTPIGYLNLHDYLRSCLMFWSKKVKQNNNYTCQVTGKRGDVVIHHIYGFNLLFEEAIDNLKFPIYDEMSQYTDKQLEDLKREFLLLQESYGEYICVSESIHKEFHSIYKYGNNTKEQWNEFINKYYTNNTR